MGVVKRNTLGRFLKKIENVSKFDLDKENIVDEVADIGLQIAKEEYAGTKTQVDAFIDTDSVKIIAQGEGIAYMEFGTGYVGKGKYKGKLPTEPLTFESPKGSGDIHTTKGWKYYYNNPETKVNGGWYLGKTFTKGREPQAQMFNTSQRLQKELAKTIAKKIKGE